MRLMSEQSETIQKFQRQKSALILQKSALELKIGKLSGLGVKAMRPAIKASLVAIRKDLGFPVEETWLADLMDSNSKEIFEAVEKFSNNVQKIIAEAQSGKSTT
jgi:hypothetical protein